MTKRFTSFNAFERAVDLMEEMATAKREGFAPLDAQNKRADAILLLLYDIATSLRNI